MQIQQLVMLTTVITDAQMAEMKKIGRLSVNSITCESVSEAHKRWEEIVASVMNACLEQDPEGKLTQSQSPSTISWFPI